MLFQCVKFLEIRVTDFKSHKQMNQLQTAPHFLELNTFCNSKNEDKIRDRVT